MSKHLDLAFVVDGSGSIQQNGFDLSRQFVSEVLDRFTVSSSDTRIGIVQFSSSAQAEVTFSGGESAAFVHNALDSMNWMNGGTQTSNGILYTKDNLFINARPDAAKVMIVLTDGASGDNSQVGANLARAEGITMMSVGVGSGIQFNELQSIADKPEYVFTMNSFDELVAAVGSFSWEVCDIVNKLTFSPTQAPITSIPTMTPSHNPVTSKPTGAPTFACYLTRNVDLGFVVDSSGSVHQDGFEASQQFLHEMIDRFHIHDESRVGVVQYSNQPELVFDFSQGEEISEIHTKLEAREWMNEGTFTGAGIEFATSNLFVDVREDATKVLIVLTDGKSNDDAAFAAKSARDEDITIFAIGIGNGIEQEELESIADHPEFIFTVEDFEELISTMHSVSNEVCEFINVLTKSPSAAPTTSAPSGRPSARTTYLTTMNPSVAPTAIAYIVEAVDSDESDAKWITVIVALVCALCIVITCWIVMDDRVNKFCCRISDEDADVEQPVDLKIVDTCSMESRLTKIASTGSSIQGGTGLDGVDSATHYGVAE